MGQVGAEAHGLLTSMTRSCTKCIDRIRDSGRPAPYAMILAMVKWRRPWEDLRLAFWGPLGVLVVVLMTVAIIKPAPGTVPTIAFTTLALVLIFRHLRSGIDVSSIGMRV